MTNYLIVISGGQVNQNELFHIAAVQNIAKSLWKLESEEETAAMYDVASCMGAALNWCFPRKTFTVNNPDSYLMPRFEQFRQLLADLLDTDYPHFRSRKIQTRLKLIRLQDAYDDTGSLYFVDAAYNFMSPSQFLRTCKQGETYSVQLFQYCK